MKNCCLELFFLALSFHMLQKRKVVSMLEVWYFLLSYLLHKTTGGSFVFVVCLELKVAFFLHQLH